MSFINFTLLLVYPQHKPFGRTDVSWNLDGTVLALGNEDGWVFWYMTFRLRCILFRSRINTSSTGDEIISKFTVYKKLFQMPIFGGDSNLSKHSWPNQSLESFKFWDEDDYEYEIFSILSIVHGWTSSSLMMPLIGQSLDFNLIFLEQQFKAIMLLKENMNRLSVIVFDLSM